MAVQPLPGATGVPDYGQPTPTSPQPENPTRPTQNISTKWSDWISQPENRAGMIQAGLNMLQPIPPGQTLGGHLASGIGSGLAAHGRNIKTRADRDLELRKIAADEESNRIRELESQSSSSGITLNQRRIGWEKFVAMRAEAIAHHRLWGKDQKTGEYFSPEQVYMEILTNPQRKAELLKEFNDQERMLASGSGMTTTRQKTLGQAIQGGGDEALEDMPEGGQIDGPDGIRYVKHNGKWVSLGPTPK